MRRQTLYSSSGRSRPAATDQLDARVPPSREAAAQPHEHAPGRAESRRLPRWWSTVFTRYERLMLLAAGALFALLLVSLYAAMQPVPRAITQQDIDAAVLH